MARAPAVYVDSLMQFGGPGLYRGRDSAQAERVGAKNGHRWCHLFTEKADCPALHAFAARIGLKRAWFQGNHYDLTPGRRSVAVRLGAVELTRHEAVAIWRKQRGQRKGAGVRRVRRNG